RNGGGATASESPLQQVTWKRPIALPRARFQAPDRLGRGQKARDSRLPRGAARHTARSTAASMFSLLGESTRWPRDRGRSDAVRIVSGGGAMTLLVDGRPYERIARTSRWRWSGSPQEAAMSWRSLVRSGGHQPGDDDVEPLLEFLIVVDAVRVGQGEGFQNAGSVSACRR